MKNEIEMCIRDSYKTKGDDANGLMKHTTKYNFLSKGGKMCIRDRNATDRRMMFRSNQAYISVGTIPIVKQMR